MAWFLILTLNTRQHAWQVPDERIDDDLVDRAKTLLAFPSGDAWIADPRYAVALTTMDRPPAGATMRQRAELDAVTPEALAAYRVQHRAALSQERMAAAREAVLRLSSEERAQVYGEIPPPPRGTETTGGSRA